MLSANRHTAKIINISRNKNISNFVDRLDADLPRAREISSLNAKFVLNEKLINNGDEIKIHILNETGIDIYSFVGKAIIDTTIYPYTNDDKFQYVVKEEHSNLFEKVIPETKVYYDLYFCNNQDEHNSLLHIAAKNLGFTEFEFEDFKLENGSYYQVPFVIFRENEKWIDELQTLIVATNSILYVHNKKLYFRACNLALNKSLKFDKTNIITNIEKRFKPNHSNGIKVLYDRYQKLDNQVVFNLKSKEIINPNTPVGANVKAARINYITSSVSNPVITKATGYYFTSDSTKSLVRVDLKEDTHYTLEEFTETQCIAKFYNPYSYTLYVDNFEIKGIPLVMYKDNNAIVKNPNVVDKNQENFEVIPKNKYVQTLEMAKNMAKLEYANRIESKYSYTFDTVFLPGVELGEIYELEIKDIKCKVRVNSFSIHLKPGNFRMKLHCDEVSEVGTVKTGNTDSLTPATQFVDLSNIEKAIDEAKIKLGETKEDVAITNQKMNSVLHKGEVAPTGAKEYDCWLNPSNNQWKQYLNGKWSPVAEKDILPAMKHFNSLEEAKLSLRLLGNKVGGFLINEGEKLGAINGVVAESSIDKKGTVTLKNVNNLLAFNVQNPANPNDIKSKFLMGVSDVNTVPSNIVFKIGEAEVTGSTIEMDINGKINIKFGKKELSEKLSEVDKNIVNTAKNINDNKKILEEKINSSKSEAKKYTDSAKNDLNSKMTEAEEKAYYLSLMANGKMLHDDPEFKEGWNGLFKYAPYKYLDVFNWEVKTLQPDDENYPPNSSGKSFVFRKGNSGSDGWFGFKCSTTARKEAIFITKIVAKIPVGFTILWYNPTLIGNNGTQKWLTSKKGTGKYETYLCYVKCGEEGTFGSINQFWIGGKPYSEAVTCYIAYATVFDCTATDTRIDDLKEEVATKFINADGRLTNLQAKYEDTVKDISSFKTVTSNKIDTVQGALANGDLTLTGNSVSDGSFRFVSRGTNEVITIADGTIDFHRNGQRLTRTKNIRYGTISTDSKGKGIVNFKGFKQPMLILASIKSVNFGKNMASEFCYSEHIEDCKYRFYVGGTTEVIKEPKPVKIMGTSWTANNVMQTTLLGYGGKIDQRTYEIETWGSHFKNNFSVPTLTVDYVDGDSYLNYNRRTTILKVPKFNIKIKLNDTVLVSKDYSLGYSKEFYGKYHSKDSKRIKFYMKRHKIDIQEELSILKKYSLRKDIKYSIEITIIEKDCVIDFACGGYNNWRYDGVHYMDSYSCRVKGVYETITKSMIKNLFINASAETSTISDTTGYGEVSYIAMEVD